MKVVLVTSGPFYHSIRKKLEEFSQWSDQDHGWPGPLNWKIICDLGLVTQEVPLGSCHHEAWTQIPEQLPLDLGDLGWKRRKVRMWHLHGLLGVCSWENGGSLDVRSQRRAVVQVLPLPPTSYVASDIFCNVSGSHFLHLNKGLSIFYYLKNI